MMNFVFIRSRLNLSAAHRERAHESSSSVSWTTHRQGCSTRSVLILLFLKGILHPYDKHRRLHWYGPRWWSSSCGDPPHRRPHTASSSQINLIARLSSDFVPSHAPPLDYDYMHIITVGNSCTLPGLASNDYISCMQHYSNLAGSSLCFSNNIIINEVDKESLPPLVHTFAHIIHTIRTSLASRHK